MFEFKFWQFQYCQTPLKPLRWEGFFCNFTTEVREFHPETSTFVFIWCFVKFCAFMCCSSPFSDIFPSFKEHPFATYVVKCKTNAGYSLGLNTVLLIYYFQIIFYRFDGIVRKSNIYGSAVRRGP